jgi:hypothetical protein
MHTNSRGKVLNSRGKALNWRGKVLRVGPLGRGDAPRDPSPRGVWPVGVGGSTPPKGDVTL